MKSTSTFNVILAATVLSGALATFAQPKPEDRAQRQPANEPGRERPQFGGAGMRGGAGAFNFLFNVLTEEQRDSFRQVSEGQREKIQGLEEKLREARRAVIEASVAEKIDEDAIRKKFMDTAKLDAELAVLRAKALSQIKPPLSKEQIEKIKNPQPFEGTPGRGRDFRPGERTRPNSPAPGRDEHDLPPPPKPQ